MALLAMLSVPALAQCPNGLPATVTYSKGVTELTSSATASFPWLSGEGVDLKPPAGAEKWLNCATWWRLGSNRQVDAGESVSIQCSSGACDVYAFLYHEPPRSSPTNGDLPGTLPNGGWTPGSCAPTFGGNGAEPRCRMTAFKKMLAVGESTSIPIWTGGPAMYLVLAVAPGVLGGCESNDLATQTACEAPETSLAKSCAWDKGQCVDNWCPRTTASPPANPNPSYCIAPLDAIADTPEIFSTGLDNSKIVLALGAIDSNWMVKKDNGAWVAAVYGQTNRYSNGDFADLPYIASGSSAGLPPNRPLAHPDHWFSGGKTGNVPDTDFFWKQSFDVPSGAVSTFSANYRLGYDDYSYGWSGSQQIIHSEVNCEHTVWVNGGPVEMPAVLTVAAVPQKYQYGTACEGTLSGPWVAGSNTIEFRIRNMGSYYGFRFIVLPSSAP